MKRKFITNSFYLHSTVKDIYTYIRLPLRHINNKIRKVYPIYPYRKYISVYLLSPLLYTYKKYIWTFCMNASGTFSWKKRLWHFHFACQKGSWIQSFYWCDLNLHFIFYLLNVTYLHREKLDYICKNKSINWQIFNDSNEPSETSVETVKTDLINQ